MLVPVAQDQAKSAERFSRATTAVKVGRSCGPRFQHSVMRSLMRGGQASGGSMR